MKQEHRVNSREAMRNVEPADHVRQTIATYDRIAPHYVVTATPELRAWEERSMRAFRDLLPGKRALVPGCGDGRDSIYLASLGLRVISFDLSGGMLSIAKAKDPAGTYIMLDLRHISALAGQFDGIWASGCLYHLSKPEFADSISQCRRLLPADGILYMNMKEGQGQRFETGPSPGYPGGECAVELLTGKRYYAYYTRGELLSYLEGFDIAQEDRIVIVRGGFEFWLRRERLDG